MNRTSKERVKRTSYSAVTSILPVAGCLFLICAVLFVPAVSFSFPVPEKLVYDLTWTGVKAGTAVLEVQDEKDSLRVISTANSAKWVSVFYTVDDRVEAVLSKGKSKTFVGRPQNFRIKLREGKHRRDKEIIFDHSRHKAEFIDHLDKDKNRKEYDVTENVFDPLSVLYYVRTLNLEAGKSVFVDVFDSKKVWNVEVQVLRKEKIGTVMGEMDTIVIKPLMKSEGIFNRKGEMLIWLTDDNKRIPVKMQTKVVVGAITATLTGGNY